MKINNDPKLIRMGGRKWHKNHDLEYVLLARYNEYTQSEDDPYYSLDYCIESDNGYFWEFLRDLVCDMPDFEKVFFGCDDLVYRHEDRNEYQGDDDEEKFLGHQQLDNGFEFFGFCGCSFGSGQINPVYGILYHDGRKLRGYIPVCGNTYNLDFNTAFGLETYDKWHAELVEKKYGSMPEYTDSCDVLSLYLVKHGYCCTIEEAKNITIEPDFDSMIKDIKSRIVVS